MPEVHNKDDSLAVAFVPNLVVERVVEDKAFTFSPLEYFLANSKPWALGNDESEMAA